MEPTERTTEPTKRTTPPDIGPTWEVLPRFAMVMAVLLALASFPQSALFTVRHIKVRGAETLSAHEVVARSGLGRAQRLFAVDAAAVRQVLLADPRIREAEVLLRPPGTVILGIRERRPVAALVAGKMFARVADDRVVVAIAPDSGGLPEVEDQTRSDALPRPGQPVASEGLRAALAALDAASTYLAGDLKRIVVARGLDLTFVTRSGMEIRAGGPSGLSERLEHVPRVLEALRAKGVRPVSLDLRYGGSVVVRPSGAGDAR